MTEETVKTSDGPVDELGINLRNNGLKLTEDSYIEWDAKNLAHPRNWTPWKKAYNIVVVLSLELIT